MLTPTQIIPFLLHDDVDVRDRAMHYLTDMGDLAPPATAEQAWLALERFGGVITPFGYPQSNVQLRLIASLAPTDATAQRTIERLRGTTSKNKAYWLNGVLRRQSLNFLAEHRGEWEPVVNADARKAIEARLALRAAGAETLWQTLVQLDIDACAAGEYDPKITQRAEPVVEALRRYPDAASANALEVLRDPRKRWWLEIWSAELACALRHAPAIDLLIATMRDDEGDFLREGGENGLARMDAELVVPALESAANAATGSDDDSLFRNSVGAALGNLKHPLSEAALMRLLEKEDDPMPRAFFATALCDLCTTEGLELLRDAVVKRNYDRSISDLMELLVTQCKFAGYAPPELPQWNKELEKKSGEIKARRNLLKQTGLGGSPRALVEMMTSLLDERTDKPAETALPPLPDSVADSAVITMPIHRAEPKVGRNEPCPCGSGKKYKKCCGAA
jgi:hypothetical protein